MVANTDSAQQGVLDSLEFMLNTLKSFDRGYTTVIVEVSRSSKEVAMSFHRDVTHDRRTCFMPITLPPPRQASAACSYPPAFEEQSRADRTPEVSGSNSAEMAAFIFDVSALKALCALIRRCNVAHGTGSTIKCGGLSPARLRRVLSYINANLREPNDLQTLAALAGLSAHHFAHAFKQSTGLPPHKYVLEQRIRRAQQLLEGEKSILEISYILGFCSQAHFTRAFKREVGISPGYYRRAISEAGTWIRNARPLRRKRSIKQESFSEC